MKYLQKISAVLILFLLAVSVGNSKPLSPLSIKMQWQGDVVQNTSMVLTLSIFSQISVDGVEISLSLPDGVTLIDGQLTELTSVEAAKPLEKKYTVQITKAATGFIRAEARLRGSGHIAFYAAATLPVTSQSVTNLPVTTDGSKQKASSRAEKKQNYKHIKHNGVLLREYQLH